MDINDIQELLALDGASLADAGLVSEAQQSLMDREVTRPHWKLSSVQEDFPNQDFGEDMFDPTGFVPLEVMIEQQRIAGRKALIQRSMFDFEDWKDIYLDTEPPVDFEDDFQVMEYIREIEDKKDKLFSERQQQLNQEFSEFLASKRKQNATTTTNNDDDAKISSNTEPENPPVSDKSSTED